MLLGRCLSLGLSTPRGRSGRVHSHFSDGKTEAARWGPWLGQGHRTSGGSVGMGADNVTPGLGAGWFPAPTTLPRKPLSLWGALRYMKPTPRIFQGGGIFAQPFNTRYSTVTRTHTGPPYP